MSNNNIDLSQYTAAPQALQRGSTHQAAPIELGEISKIGFKAFLGTFLLYLVILGGIPSLIGWFFDIKYLAPGNSFGAAIYVILWLMVGAPLYHWSKHLLLTGYSADTFKNYSFLLMLWPVWTIFFSMGVPYGGKGMAVATVLAIVMVSIFTTFAGRKILPFAPLGFLVRRPRQEYLPANATQATQVAVVPAKKEFGLLLGHSTGFLASQGHNNGLSHAHQPVVLSLNDACQNIIIFGGIGSGKTTRLISPLLLQVLNQDSGVLAFDIKSDFVKEMTYLCGQSGRNYEVIGAGGLNFNLFEGLTPEVAASFLKSAFMKSGGKGEAIWIESAVELCRNALNLLQYNLDNYSLAGLYNYIFDSEFTTNINDEMLERLAAGDMPEIEARTARTSFTYFEKVFATLDEKVQSGVRFTCAQVLSPFTTPALHDAFCSRGDSQARMESLLDGKVYLVEIPVTQFGKEGSAYAYLFLKLRFMMVMKARRMTPEWNQDRPVVFMCDEYQAIVDSVSDTDFWDKSRSSKTIGIVSMQGVASMLDAVGNDKATNNILQNFRQTLVFGNEDKETIDRMNFLLGKVEITKVSKSEGQNTSNNAQGQSSGSSTTTNTTTEYREVANPQLFRQMGQDQALAVLKIGGVSTDDVINCRPIFLPS